MEGLIDCVNDISKVNIIYTVILVAGSNCLTASSASNDNLFEFLSAIIMMSSNNYNTSSLGFDGDASSTSGGAITAGGFLDSQTKSSLPIRMFRRLIVLTENLIIYAQNQFTEHTATSIASFSVLIIVLSIFTCAIISLMREEERKIKEQYKKLNTGSSSSFIAIGQGNKYTNNGSSSSSSYHDYSSSSSSPTLLNGFRTQAGHFLLSSNTRDSGSSASSNNNHHTINYSPLPPRQELFNKVHVIELRRETYFGLVRLSKPGCRTIVLLCDQQSKVKLLAKFYQCIYPYRKNKILMFAFLLIEKNIGWYEDLLKMALNEKRDLHINPINCIGTVLILNGFKKWFSVYHESDSRCEPDEPFVLLEESLLDNLSGWLEKALAGGVSRFHVRYWPHQMK